MNVLFLCPNVPHPPLNGGHHRNLGLIRAIARFASVRVLAVGDPGDERVPRAQEALAAWGATLSAYAPTGPGPAEDDAEDTARRPDAAAHFRSPELAAAVRACAESSRFDVVHVEEVVMAQYAGALPWPRVLDRQKVDWAYHEAMARVAPADALAHLREAARFRAWERELVGGFDRMLVAGEGDRALLEPLHGPGVVSLVPIGIDDTLAPPADPARRVDHVLLYGARDYAPNVEAEQWYFREVWPALRAASPLLRTVIVGSGRPPLRAEGPPRDPRVELRGWVPHVRGVLQGPGVLVVPVRVGGGARTKVLEALACGMPVVSTALGVENLGLVPGRHYLPAETADETVAAVLRLAGDPGQAVALGRAGAERAAAHRWSRIERTLEPIYREVASGAGRAAREASRSFALGVRWSAPADVLRLHAELAARSRRPAARAWQRALRRVRRSWLVQRAESAARRWLDRRSSAGPSPG